MFYSIVKFKHFTLYDKYIKYLSIQPPFIVYFIYYFLYNLFILWTFYIHLKSFCYFFREITATLF
ncbi:hypothetical protein C7Y58_03425 [Fusobacterium nucleatum subsp. nucleatum ATCC 25586]|uniref:Uncharacterized protein n=1 Tax=Fusobacterium nucleatum subsp. nucleatum (strain ATCC 25586 / DSM 15643 / BCRC 10681 / CIP 101130 / JCM 8532 / KCTC 2640 / LMG 13131 / VPI 4355) TaxID=190304 RepID=Q8RHW0_FUSNN|nr:unknown [Fusobacterium nucleatum subsp. nucleatum ATCC 25586]AVQ14597.1 hypothetical protein C7Y58_03425 [Fusobacterium nucleatum subsp. nucleatum ATCC 25586]